MLVFRANMVIKFFNVHMYIVTVNSVVAANILKTDLMNAVLLILVVKYNISEKYTNNNRKSYDEAKYFLHQTEIFRIMRKNVLSRGKA